MTHFKANRKNDIERAFYRVLILKLSHNPSNLANYLSLIFLIISHVSCHISGVFKSLHVVYFINFPTYYFYVERVHTCMFCMYVCKIYSARVDFHT